MQSKVLQRASSTASLKFWNSIKGRSGQNREADSLAYVTLLRGLGYLRYTFPCLHGK